jgi:hydroxymethylbilane synthase
MTDPLHLSVGTRGSQMALVQTDLVVEPLKAHHPGLVVTVKVITTKGDIDHSVIPVDTVGKAWFTKEIEQALLDGQIDLAVHSLKDMPPNTPPGLVVSPVLARDDPRDALIAKNGQSLEDLPRGAIVGTDSLRRKAMLLAQRPDLTVRSVRGNANTRLQKLAVGDYDALVLAAAGLHRIERGDEITEYFDPTVFIPAIGQGALAAEWSIDRPEVTRLIEALEDPPTRAAVAAEQAFAQTIGGGCKLPLGCYAYFVADYVNVYGMVGSMDGSISVTKATTGPADQAVGLAQTLAAELAKEPFVMQ